MKLSWKRLCPMKNDGFTLIELVIAMLLGTFVVLGVSVMFRFISVNWLTQIKGYFEQEDISLLDNLINTQFKEIMTDPIHRLTGDEKKLEFFTRKSGTFIPSYTGVSYEVSDNKLKICFKSIAVSINATTEKIEFTDEDCTYLENIKDVTFSYLVKDRDEPEWKNSIKNTTPMAISITVVLKKDEKSAPKVIYAVH